MMSVLRCLMLTSVGASALVGFQAIAQESAAAQANQQGQAATEAGASALGDIVVTARKRIETSMAVPVQVTAFTGAQLQARAITSLDVVARQTPGIVLGEGGVTAQGGNLAIRGVQGADTNLLGDQAVSFNIDGIQIAKASVRRMAQMDMAQIEVLKGPQALFFGKNSPGGVISVRTADPTSELAARVSAGYEFVGREKKIEGFVSGPITDQLGARFAFYGSDLDGWVKSRIPDSVPPPMGIPSSGRNRGPGIKEYAGRLTLKFEPSDMFDARLKATYNKMWGSPPTYSTQLIDCPTNGRPFSRNGAIILDDCRANNKMTASDTPDTYNALNPIFAKDDFQRQKQALAGLEMNYHPTDDITVTSVTGYYKVKYKTLFLSSATYDISTILPSTLFIDNREFSQEIRLTSSYDGPVNFTLGGFFQDADAVGGVASGQAVQSIPGGLFDTFALLPSSFRYHQKTRAYSAFGQIRWNIFDTLELAAGGRYSKETKRLPGRNAVQIGNPFAPATVVETRKISFNDFSPELSLTYRPTSNLTVYGSYKRGFLSGGFNTGAANPARGLTYDQEIVKGFEAGVKALLLDGALRTNLAAYTYKAKGLQLIVTTGPGLLELRNAGAARIKGVEFDANYRTPIEGLYLQGAVAYTRGRYLDYIASCYGGQSAQQGCTFNTGINAFTQDLAGSQTLRTPDWQGNVGFTYDRPVTSGLKLGLSGDMSFSSSYFTDAPNDPRGRMHSYQLYNAALRLGDADDKWELALIGRNLGNKYYWVRSADRSFTAAGTGASNGTSRLADKLGNISRGREVFLRVTVNY